MLGAFADWFRRRQVRYHPHIVNRAFAAVAFASASLSLGVLPGAEPDLSKAQRDFFESKIRPVLVEHCYGCHSAEAKKVEADYLLDTRAGIRKGGASGRDAVIPGDLSGSQLLEAIRYENPKLQMPPSDHGEKLSGAVIADFETWITMGAPDPRDGESKLPRELAAESHWAFQPVIRPELPPVKNADWPRDRIDHFVLAKLESKKLEPVGDADRSMLIRRATLELTGLPPTLEEIRDFLIDPAPDDQAFATVVDRLLDSPAFGERWGRHWLDVARYAESSGYSRNMLYPYAWRYRDWVIDAFNADKPYDRFLTEQLAGDLLPADSPSQRDARHIATGFLTIGPKTLNEGDPLLFELNVADDQIDATCRAFLALTANCARCHDHKYDPIPTADYYALAGIFRSSQNLAGTSTNVRAEHETAWAMGPDGEQALKRIEEATKKADETQAAYMELVKKRNDIRDPLEKKGIDWRKNPTPALTAAEAEVQRFQDLVRAAKAAIPASPDFAMAVKDAPVMTDADWKTEEEAAAKDKKLPRPLRIADSPIFNKGLHDQPLEPVARGVLSLFEPQLKAPSIPADESGRRQLAAWLTDPNNPLPARVMVNRVWHHLFGTGLVETVDNFGLLGASPSHPELLDDLALRFSGEEMNWSMKRLIRTIMLSRAWRLSSTVDETSYAVDPDNRLIWRFAPQRLEGEAIRDSLLFVGTGLDEPPADGSQVFTISMKQAKPLQREIGRRDYYYQDVDENVRYRSVYLPMARDVLFDSLKVFDAPDPNLVVGGRKLTIVPTQALFLMNSQLVLEQAAAMAERIAAGVPYNPGQRAMVVYLSLLAREPSPEEKSLMSEFVLADGNSEKAWAEAIQAVMASGEFRTVY